MKEAPTSGRPATRAAGDAPAPGAPLFWIAGDLRAKARWLYGSDRPADVAKACLADGTLAMVLYRMMQQSARCRIAPLTMLLNKLNLLLSGCLIGRHAELGPRLVFIHALGVVINTTVRGGADLRIEHQVTIGAERGESPLLGDRVFVGAGAKVLGPVRVGDGAKIGANAVVVKDVPPGATVVGVPARVVRAGDPTDGGCATPAASAKSPPPRGGGR